ncbi:MAG: 3-hydroxyacyl-CoA dehydrogenase NAD-binding domain-containing protein [Trueperaceae bacterium]
MTSIELELHDGIAVLRFRRDGEGPNLLDRGALDALPPLLERLESDLEIEGVVVTSRNPAGFMAGADIALFDGLKSREEALELVLHAQSLVERLARLPKPAVAAIHGPCAGGGLELALACDYRLASIHASTSLSLPEVRLGLLPALGGTQRLPRLIGLAPALELLLTGRSLYARPARRSGLVDATVHHEGLEEAAIRTARELASRSAVSREASGDRPKRHVWSRLLESAPGRELVYRRAGQEARKQGRGNYPAPPRIIETVRRSFGGPLGEGLRLESEAFVDLLFSAESRALRHLFFVRTRTRRQPFRAEARPVKRIAVLGAGLMGAGIAQVSSHPGGYAVLLTDRSLELAARGKAAAHEGLSERLGKGLTRFEIDSAAERVVPAAGYERFGSVDLTIEAVLEDLDLKRRVLNETEAVARDDHVFASNTSSLPISRLAEGAARPENVVGMHYFSPVPKMPLLEVVRGTATSGEALATAVSVGLRQGKSVIVVGDSPGFYVNRILAPYLNEALLLVREGAAIAEVDRAMEDGGFPVGPFRLLDNVGLEVAAKVTGVLAPLFAERGVRLDEFAGRLAESGMTGRKAGAGFYSYPKSGRRRPNQEAYRLLGARERRTVPPDDIRARLLLALVNEAQHCLDEKIISSRDDGDAGAVFGIGFPPFLGGPFHYIAVEGGRRVRERLEALQASHGERFKPADGLVTPAVEG